MVKSIDVEARHDDSCDNSRRRPSWMADQTVQRRDAETTRPCLDCRRYQPSTPIYRMSVEDTLQLNYYLAMGFRWSYHLSLFWIDQVDLLDLPPPDWNSKKEKQQQTVKSIKSDAHTVGENEIYRQIT